MVPKENRVGNDIYFDFQEAQRIIAGENPNERILGRYVDQSEVCHLFSGS